LCTQKISYPNSEKHFVVPYWNLPSMVFDGAINGVNSLINWKKTAFAKSNSLQTQKNGFSIDGIKRQNH
jgi:hypothetical protein